MYICVGYHPWLLRDHGWLPASYSYPANSQNGIINRTGLSSFLGFSTLHHWMMSSLVHAFHLVKSNSIASLSLLPSVIGRMLLVPLMAYMLNCHPQSQTHKQCMEQAVSFIAVMEKNKQSIKSQHMTSRSNWIQEHFYWSLIAFCFL